MIAHEAGHLVQLCLHIGGSISLGRETILVLHALPVVDDSQHILPLRQAHLLLCLHHSLVGRCIDGVVIRTEHTPVIFIVDDAVSLHLHVLVLALGTSNDTCKGVEVLVIELQTEVQEVVVVRSSHVIVGILVVELRARQCLHHAGDSRLERIVQTVNGTVLNLGVSTVGIKGLGDG